MQKPGKIVVKETKYIAISVAVLSLVMNIVFVITGYWNYTVLLGNILSGIFAVLNFLLMGMTIEKAVMQDEKAARNTIKTSQTLRQLMLLAIGAIGALVPCFNIWATIIPLLFPRIAVALKPLFGNNN